MKLKCIDLHQKIKLPQFAIPKHRVTATDVGELQFDDSLGFVTFTTKGDLYAVPLNSIHAMMIDTSKPDAEAPKKIGRPPKKTDAE